MEQRREDRLYVLQQAVAAMPRRLWVQYLAERCPDEPDIRQEVIRRQTVAEGRSLTEPAKFRLPRVPGRFIDRSLKR